jgi:hypothetical protein
MLAMRLATKLCAQRLTTSIAFFASKMQASSTQKTKDSAGRRLGYRLIYAESKYLETNRSIRTILLPDREDSNGNREKM